MALDAVAVSQELGKLEARVTNLEGWQKTQNGHLQRIEEKLDDFKDSQSRWLTGLLGGVIASLIILIVNLAIMYFQRGGR